MVFLFVLLNVIISPSLHAADELPPSGITNVDRNLLKATQQVLNYVSSPVFTAEDCEPFLNNIYSEIFSTSPDYFEKRVLETQHTDIANNLWLSRIALREKLKKWHDEKLLAGNCVGALKKAQRVGRSLEDYLLALSASNPRLLDDRSNATKVFEGPRQALQVEPRVGEIKLVSGDVLLSRGSAMTTALLARVADQGSEFSNLAIYHLDEKGAGHVVESQLDVGAVVTSWESYRADGKSRMTVYRHADAKVAAESAKKIFQKISASKGAKKIQYDFAMDSKDHKNLYGAELVALAYDLGSQGKIKLPQFPSKVTVPDDLLQRLTMNSKEIFAPADIELDSRFQLIGEWRDLNQVGVVHEIDSVMTAMLTWIQDKDYELKESWRTALLKYATWNGRRLPAMEHSTKEKFPKNMPPSLVGTVKTLQDVGEILAQDLSIQNMKTSARTGFRMTPTQMIAYLEDVRAQDAAEWKKTFGRAKFHDRFRP
jgi:hypothetical protein